MDDLKTLSGLADLSFTILVLGGVFLYRIWGVGEIIKLKREELELRIRRLRSENIAADLAEAKSRSEAP